MLVKNQLQRKYQMKKKHIVKQIKKIRLLLSGCNYTINHVYREFNKGADRLANKAMDDRKSSFISQEIAPETIDMDFRQLLIEDCDIPDNQFHLKPPKPVRKRSRQVEMPVHLKN